MLNGRKGMSDMRMKRFAAMIIIVLCSAGSFLLSSCSNERENIENLSEVQFTNNNIFAKSLFQDSGTVDNNLNNDNNFRTGMSYYNDCLYYVNDSESNEIKIIGDSDREPLSFSGGEFAIYNGKLYYVKNDKIIEKSLTNGQEREIALGDTFCFYKNYLFTRLDNSIIKVDLKSLKPEKVFESDKKILWQSACSGKLYVIYSKAKLNLTVIDLNGNKASELELDCGFNNFLACIFDNNLIIGKGNAIYNFDLTTGKKVDSMSCDNLVTMTGINNNLYFSAQKTTTDGSVTHLTDSEDNGLWRYDVLSHSKEKISSDAYSRIYACGDEYIFLSKTDKSDFGIFTVDSSNAELYQMNLKSMDIKRIA